jgi:transposase
VVGVAIEACSGAANLADELIQFAKWPVHLAHPGYVARMKQSPDKSDFSDARMLADLERVGYLPRVWLAPEAIRELRMLVRYRQQLVNERRSTKLRIGAVLREQRLRQGSYTSWTLRWMDWLRHEAGLSAQGRWVVDRHLEKLEWVVKKIVESHHRLTSVTQQDPLVNQLCSYKGIGEVTAWTIRAEIGRFDRFSSGKQLARFCGLSPRNASSGNRQADAGLIKAGNGPLRGVLIEAAHRLARFDPHWSAMAFRMKDRGKRGSLVAAAIANRWMRWLYHQMKQAPVAA